MSLDRTCRQCGKKHSSEEVKRVLGEYSAPFTTGFCSAYCYTQFKLNQKVPPNVVRKDG